MKQSTKTFHRVSFERPTDTKKIDADYSSAANYHDSGTRDTRNLDQLDPMKNRQPMSSDCLDK